MKIRTSPKHSPAHAGAERGNYTVLHNAGAYSRPTLEPPSESSGGHPETETAPAADEMAAESPITSRDAAAATETRDVRWTSNDAYGAFSVEQFANAGGLSYTHEDAQGFINFLGGTAPANFWYRDAGVQPWAYYETYDNWQDTYGMDAVLAPYHSGHGTMDGNGVFYAPLGSDWGGLGSWVRSDQMRLGNEQANYIFWSTCLSLRVLGGHSPIRTWNQANLGFRMLFGFETVSWDNPNYGKFFGEEWRKNKSFSTAWMDASWRIAHDQAPSVVACGATPAEAQNRVFNERMFQWPHVSKAHWWWRWYNASSSAAVAARRPSLTVPDALLSARLQPTNVNAQAVGRLIERIGLEIRRQPSLAPQRNGSFQVREGDSHLTMSADGSFDAQFATANRENRSAMAPEAAVAAATDYLRELKLDDDIEVVFDRVRIGAEGGGTDRGSGRIEGPFVNETTVQFKQLINGLPVITPGQGELRVSIDNDAQITSVHSSVRGVDRLQESRPTAPTPAASPYSGPSDGPAQFEQSLAGAWGRRLAAFALRGPMPMNFTIVPDSTEVGYTMEGNHAQLVAQRAIEVDFGQGLRKRYWVTVPLAG